MNLTFPASAFLSKLILSAIVLASNGLTPTLAQSVKGIADSNNAFAFDLYSHINNNGDRNLIFSPFSISSALAMTYAGARAETESQMSHTLHFTPNRDVFQTQYGDYLGAIERDTGAGLQLCVANSLWAQQNYSFSHLFCKIIDSNYKSTVHRVNFADRTERERARKEINNWVAQKTDSKIKELISPGVLDNFTMMVIVNAIYFNGKWSSKFDKKLTCEDRFRITSAKEMKALFMHKFGKYNCYEDGRIKAVEIPYAGKTTSMIIILPDSPDSMKNIESSVNAGYFNKIVNLLQEKEVQLSLPKFKADSRFELGKPLAAMGMPDAFNEKADFSGMSAKSEKGLFISRVIHEACIDVTEEGTEAAAATAVIGKIALAPPPQNIFIFNVNHPFIFIIKDNVTQGVLFMGEVYNPVAG